MLPDRQSGELLFEDLALISSKPSRLPTSFSKLVPYSLDKSYKVCYCSSVTTQITDDPMTARQAAKQIGVHFTTIYRWIESNKIAWIRFGGILFIPRSEVRRLQKENHREESSPVV